MNFWTGTKVLVTGAHGFTGSHLSRQLHLAGASVRGLIKKAGNLSNLEDLSGKMDIFYGDVTDIPGLALACKGIDYVFHPAAIVPVMDARNNPQRAFEVNSIGTFNVAQASLNAGVKKMLHVSTCHVYGNLPESELPLKETAVPHPGDLYAASKYAAEIYLRPLINEGAPIVISRAFAKYGPGQGSQYLIPRIITQILSGERPKLGSPRPSRDYSHIVDLAKGYMAVLEKGTPGEIYHLASDKETTVGEVYRTIAKILNYTQEPQWNDSVRPQDILRLFGNSSKAQKLTGWKPEISFESGLMETIDWWKGRPNN